MPKFYSQIDLTRIPIKGLVPESSPFASPPATPVEGQLWYDTTNKKTMAYQNGAWVDLSLNSSYTTGTAAQIATGTDTTSQVWKAADLKTAIVANSVQPSSTTPVMDGTGTAGSGTTYSRADHAHPSDTSRLAVSAFNAQVPASTVTAGQYLRSNGTAGQAAWTTPGNIQANLGSTGAANPLAGNIGVTGTLPLANGGTGGTNAATARTNLGAAPTASPTFTGTVTVPTPSAGTAAANKDYVDNAVQTAQQGLDAKTSVKVATTANISLASMPSTIDGISVVFGDRVLVKNQTAPAENGIYFAGLPFTRVPDMDAWTEFPSAFVFVEQGTANADTGWICTNDAGGTLDTTAVTWVQFSAAGVVTAGAGLTKTGNVISVATGGITGAMILDGAVAAAELASDSVITAKILDANVTRPKMAFNSVDSSAIVDNSIMDININTSADISGSKLANNSVGGSKIGAGAIALDGPLIANVLPIANGGTGAVDRYNALINLNATSGFQFSSPALTAGTWSTAMNIPTEFSVGGLMLEVSIYDATTYERVFLDVKISPVAGQFQIKSDVAAASGAFDIRVSMQNRNP